MTRWVTTKHASEAPPKESYSFPPAAKRSFPERQPEVPACGKEASLKGK